MKVSSKKKEIIINKESIKISRNPHRVSMPTMSWQLSKGQIQWRTLHYWRKSCCQHWYYICNSHTDLKFLILIMMIVWIKCWFVFLICSCTHSGWTQRTMLTWPGPGLRHIPRSPSTSLYRVDRPVWLCLASYWPKQSRRCWTSQRWRERYGKTDP